MLLCKSKLIEFSYQSPAPSSSTNWHIEIHTIPKGGDLPFYELLVDYLRHIYLALSVSIFNEKSHQERAKGCFKQKYPLFTTIGCGPEMEFATPLLHCHTVERDKFNFRTLFLKTHSCNRDSPALLIETHFPQYPNPPPLPWPGGPAPSRRGYCMWKGLLWPKNGHSATMVFVGIMRSTIDTVGGDTCR